MKDKNLRIISTHAEKAFHKSTILFHDKRKPSIKQV